MNRLFAILISGAVLACAGQVPAADQTASATLKPLGDSKVSGTVEFVQRDDAIDVSATVTGLAPNSERGFHVHEKGDCSAPDGSSAGGHFAPRGEPHGPQDAAHHAGDMPSLKADADGMATLKFRMGGVTIAPGPYSVAGKGVIVHGGVDDFKSQPSGNSGSRAACGVVQPNVAAN